MLGALFFSHPSFLVALWVQYWRVECVPPNRSSPNRHLGPQPKNRPHTCMAAIALDSRATFRKIARRMPALHQLSVLSYTSSGDLPAAPTTVDVSSSVPAMALPFAVFSFQIRLALAARKFAFAFRVTVESGVDEREDGAVSMKVDVSDASRECAPSLGESMYRERENLAAVWGRGAVGEGSLVMKE